MKGKKAWSDSGTSRQTAILSPLNAFTTRRVPPCEGRSYRFTRLFRGHTQGDKRDEGVEIQGPAPLARFLALWGVSPSHSLSGSFLFLSLHLSSNLSISVNLCLLLSFAPGLSSALWICFCLPISSRSPATPSPSPRLRSPHASHSITVFFRNVISLTFGAREMGCGQRGSIILLPRRSPLSLFQTPSPWHHRRGPSPHGLPTPRSLLSQPLLLLPWDFLLPSRIRTLSRRTPHPWDTPPPRLLSLFLSINPAPLHPGGAWNATPRSLPSLERKIRSRTHA